MADRNVVEIVVTSRNKTKAAFAEAEAEAEATGGRISAIFSRMSDSIGSKLKSIGANMGKNLGKGGGLFALGANALSMAGPLAAAGAAVGAFGAVAIPILTKVAAAHAALAKAQQKYNQAVTSKQKLAALKAEQAATAGLTTSEKGLMGPISQLQAMWGSLENSMAPVVVDVVKVALSLARDLMPAFQTLASVGGNALETILGYLGEFVRSPAFATMAGQLGQLASAIAPLIGQTLAQLIQLLMQLFTQAGPAGVQLLSILLPLIIRITTDLLPAITAVAEITAKMLAWLQAQHLLLPALALVAVAILSMEAPIGLVAAAVVILIAAGVELARNWSKIWHEVANVFDGARHEVQHVLDDMRHDIARWTGDVLHTVADGFDQVRSHIHAAWSSIVNDVTGFLKYLLQINVKGFELVVHGIESEFDRIRHDTMALVDDVVNFFAQLPGRVLGVVGNLGSDVLNSVTGGLGGLAHMIGLATGGIATAAGGGARGGFTLVGERGPELVRLPRGSHVLPAGQSAAMLGGAGGGGAQHLIIELRASDSKILSGLQAVVREAGGDGQMFIRKVAFR